MRATAGYTSHMLIETRAVLAGAYTGKGSYSRSTLTHSVEVDKTGEVVRVLCGRVSTGSVADRFAGDVQAEPTCERCRKKRGV